MWPQEMIDGRNRVLHRQEMVKALPKEFSGTFVHLGCGPDILEGFRNVDKFHQDPRVENYDMWRLPYLDESVDVIYSSHALEHLPFRRAKAALLEMGRVLKPTGRLYLAIPDLEIIMQVLLSPDVSREHKWDWFVYTLFGYQTDTGYRGTDLDVPLDPGQFHQCGFTKETITQYLADAKLEVKVIYNYDGWDTPSMWVEAVKSV